MKQITESAEALQEIDAKFKAITSSAKDAIIIMDNEGCISYWNEAAEKIFGYSSDEALGNKLHKLLVPDKYRDAFRRGFSAFKTTGDGPVVGDMVEFEATRKDGTIFPVELSVSAVIIKGNWHAVGIIRDISKRKQAEIELNKRGEKLSALYAIANAANRSLDLQQILNATLNTVMDMIKPALALIHLYNEQTKELTLKAHRGISRDFAGAVSHLRSGYIGAYRVLKSGQPIIVEDILKHPDPGQEALVREGISSFVTTPLKSKDKLLGTIFIGYYKLNGLYP